MTKDPSVPWNNARNVDLAPDDEDDHRQDSKTPVVNIAECGDLILSTRTGSETAAVLFRVDSHRLKARSAFFRALLESSFREGVSVRDVHEKIRQDGAEPASAPAAWLPQIDLEELGSHAMTDLLRILHGQDMSYHRPGVRHLAGLATLADQYDCLPEVAEFVHQKNFLLTLNKKSKGSSGAEVSEEHLRQKILVGWLLDYPQWLTSCSQRLIVRGSSRWVDDDVLGEAKQGVWWDLPHDLEAELQARRELILETVNSLVVDFLGPYTSKQRQCSLGYSNSAECDSFQLGEAIRFLSRIGTVQVQGLIYDTHVGEPTARSISEIISTLRQVPSYQIDQHHSHCGLRTKLTPPLQFLQFVLDYGVGVCRDCWKHDRPNSRWSNAAAAGKWTMPHVWSDWFPTGRPRSCKEHEAKIKALFTASARQWA
ncbi:MAG: hypothetical protein M1815_001512 [Lichina confinis]|nr:MAG: hypothetical protein M1815_001512 [Lichina confinis]